MTYKLIIELKSDTLIGSGEGYGAIVDSDVVFDSLGLPYIPVKRIKGMVRESAEEVEEMCRLSGLNLFSPKQVEMLFGKPGNEKSAPVYFYDLYIVNYEDNYQWLEYFTSTAPFNNLFSRDTILNSVTNLRKQTSIEEEGVQKGVAKAHSLRTARVLNQGLVFEGKIEITSSDQNDERLLSIACANFRNMGTKRNRGFGEIQCKLVREVDLSQKYVQELEAICTV